MNYTHSEYLRSIFIPERLKETVDKTTEHILKLQPIIKFQAIAFRGNSGAGIAFPVSYATGIPLICVRKGENSHGNCIEGANLKIDRYLILDDFIDMGHTVKAIIDTLHNDICVGIYLYTCDHGYESWDAIPVFNLKNFKLPKTIIKQKKGKRQ